MIDATDGRAAAAHDAAAIRAQLAAAARVQHGAPPSQPRTGYAGLVTRAIAFALDAALIDAVALVVAAVVALTVSVLHLPGGAKDAIVAAGAAAFVLWTIGYFAAFWSTTGQTPGSRLMQIRVRDAGGGERVPLRRALVRFAGVVLSAIPLGAGFAPILLNDRRRGLHDYVARTVVVHAHEARLPRA
ncbi:MAG: domain containing protein [Conexibacter sp.]|jgi:uncharacterized RDD family membrane protein YckC|nr:domain containing protein [Conexibacter sp.]